MHNSTLAKLTGILLFLGLIAFYFFGLGQWPFIGPDEPRYAQVAHEMFTRHDWISPTLGGFLWFEKPALLYWLVIIAFKSIGVSEIAARSAAAVCGLFTIAAVYFIARRLEREAPAFAGAGLWTAVVTGSCGGVIAFSRAANFDIVITATVAWAVAFFFFAELDVTRNKQTLPLAGFYFAVGLSLLAKGLVGIVVPFGIAGSYYVLRGRAPARAIRNSLAWGSLLAAAVAASWYGPMIWRHGSPFLVEFIIKHHFARYATNIYHHPQPIYFYLEILPTLALPWTIFFFAAIWEMRKLVWRSGDDAASKLMTLAVGWIVVPLIFFSFSGSKLPGYILPALPAATLLVGIHNCARNKKRFMWAMRVTGVAAVACAIGVMIYARQSHKFAFAAAAAIGIACAAIGVVALLVRQTRIATATIAVGTVVIAIVAATSIAPALVRSQSSKDIIAAADARGYANLKIFGLQRDDRSPEFYGSGRVVYGNDHEPVMYEGIGQLIYESHARGKMLFLIPLSDLDALQKAESISSDIVADNGRVAIVAITPL